MKVFRLLSFYTQRLQTVPSAALQASSRHSDAGAKTLCCAPAVCVQEPPLFSGYLPSSPCLGNQHMLVELSPLSKNHWAGTVDKLESSASGESANTTFGLCARRRYIQTWSHRLRMKRALNTQWLLLWWPADATQIGSLASSPSATKGDIRALAGEILKRSGMVSLPRTCTSLLLKLQC